MSENEKILKELVWDIHAQCYWQVPQPVFDKRKRYALPKKDKSKAHRVTDTAGQKEAKN